MKRRAAPRLGNHLLRPALYSVDFTLRRKTSITSTGNFIVQRLALAILLPGDLTRNRTISQTLYQSVVSQIVLYFFPGIFEFLAVFSLSYIDSIAVSLFTKGEQEGDAILCIPVVSPPFNI